MHVHCTCTCTYMYVLSCMVEVHCICTLCMCLGGLVGRAEIAVILFVHGSPALFPWKVTQHLLIICILHALYIHMCIIMHEVL